MEMLKTNRQNLKKFGITMSAAFAVITTLIFLRHRYSIVPTFVISASFLLISFIAPFVLRPVYVIWMKLAFILSWINTRLILSAMFYLVLTPIGVILRLFGVDFLHRKLEKSRESYWIKIEKKGFNPLDYERQF
ncbi:MAG: sxtJ [Candidatus Omnitrophica bacterium]|nr:sxtJ [Candidatus Omnitrophota bacterium]